MTDKNSASVASSVDSCCSPDMCNFAETLRYPWKRAIARKGCQFSQRRDFERCLDLIQRLAVRGITDA